MPKKTTKRDPVIAAAQRKATAQRRIGENAKCSECDERRPLALARKSTSVMCIEDIRKKKGYTPLDRHHPAGKVNHPATIQIPANDHRAIFNEEQQEWDPETLSNPRRSPARRAAACVKGVIGSIKFLLDKLLGWIPEFLEKLDEALTETLGEFWWRGTILEKFA